MNIKVILMGVLLALMSCQDAIVPKPKGYLRLEYPEPKYELVSVNKLPLSFDKNELAQIKNLQFKDSTFSLNLDYKRLNGTLYITYKPINKSEAELNKLLRDAQNITQKHTIKADAITEQVFTDSIRSVHGMLYEISGDVASQSQFYVTDSVNHFVTGSLYFYAKPNYDSILPAANYLKNDIRRLMESLKWN